MIARDDEFDEDRKARIMRVAVPAAILAGVVGAVWYFLHDTAGIRREAPPLPTLTATLPPPPPPPPKPKEKPPEPEKKIEEVQKPTPTPKLDAPRPVTINGPAQAGADAFNIGAGEGGGSVGTGGGFGAENYERYLTSTVQSAIEQDDRLNHAVFRVQIAARVDQNRRLHIRILQSSGDPKIDSDLISLADSMPALEEEPPGPLEFRFAVSGRRPA